MNTHKVIISADSTCDLTPDVVAKYGILIDPMPILLGDRSCLDGVDVFQQDVFDYTNSTGQLPKTSAQNTAHYEEYFARLTEDGSSVIHFNISASMSGSYNAANMAALDMENVHVIDSINLSTGIGLLVIKAAEMAADGSPADQIVEYIERMKHRVDASFVIDTLVNLHKGGRCSTVALLGANALKLKPCIEVKNGAMAVVKKYRGKMGNVLLEYAKDRLADLQSVDPDRIFITHTCTQPDLVQPVREYVESLGYFNDIVETTAGCTVSAHCGPNTLGVLFVRKQEID